MSVSSAAGDEVGALVACVNGDLVSCMPLEEQARLRIRLHGRDIANVYLLRRSGYSTKTISYVSSNLPSNSYA